MFSMGFIILILGCGYARLGEKTHDDNTPIVFPHAAIFSPHGDNCIGSGVMYAWISSLSPRHPFGRLKRVDEIHIKQFKIQ